MKKVRKLLLIVLIAGLSLGDTVYCQENFPPKNVTWILQGGIFHGSIVGRNKVDGVSGATKTLWSASAGAEVKIKAHHFQIGCDFGKTDQHIDYQPLSQGGTYDPFRGKRDISLLLLNVPLLYNFHFYPAADGIGRLTIGVGGFASFVLSKQINSQADSPGLLPPASISSCALGPFFRVAFFPLDFERIQPGLFFDYYRSFIPNHFYDDALFRQNSIAGQLGIISCGISFRLK
jgi:hypothetical protein